MAYVMVIAHLALIPCRILRDSHDRFLGVDDPFCFCDKLHGIGLVELDSFPVEFVSIFVYSQIIRSIRFAAVHIDGHLRVVQWLRFLYAIIDQSVKGLLVMRLKLDDMRLFWGCRESFTLRVYGSSEVVKYDNLLLHRVDVDSDVHKFHDEALFGQVAGLE